MLGVDLVTNVTTPEPERVVRGVATQEQLDKYREEHGHNPIVGNPIRKGLCGTSSFW